MTKPTTHLSRFLALTLAVCAFSLAGCYSRVVRMPGVLDLRSDGSGLETYTYDDDNTLPTREGLHAVLAGEGPVVRESRVVVEEREAWALGFFPVYNADSTEELQAVLNESNIMCEVLVEESVNGVDVGLYFTKLVPVVNIIGMWATPTFTGVISARPAHSPTTTPTKSTPGETK